MAKIGSLNIEGRGGRAADSGRWIVTLREVFQHNVTGVVFAQEVKGGRFHGHK